MIESLPADVNDDKQQLGRPGRSGVGLALLAVMLALASLLGSGWLWWQNSRTAGSESASLAAEVSRRDAAHAQLDSRVVALEQQVSGLASADPGARLGKVEQEISALQGSASDWKTFQLETSAWTRSMQAAIEGDQARLAGAEARLAALAAREMQSSAELDLAEIDYVLRLAQERLQLFGDTRTAAQALQIASRHVAAIDNPLYIGLQREIASAQQKLALVTGPDYPAVYNTIDQLQGSVLVLPFKGAGSIAAASNATAAEPGETGWWARLRQAFAGLVTVRRDSGVEDQWPVMADQEMVRQQAWLELEVARLAAMRRDQESWSAALKRLSATLQRWFEPSGPELQQALSLLETLQLVNVDPVLPDISAPWAALQAIRASGVSILPAEAAAPTGELVDDEPAGDGTE